MGAVGSTQLLNAFVTKYYPAQYRATGLGWGLGIGKDWSYFRTRSCWFLAKFKCRFSVEFYTFVIAGLVAVTGMVLIPNKKDEIV